MSDLAFGEFGGFGGDGGQFSFFPTAAPEKKAEKKAAEKKAEKKPAAKKASEKLEEGETLKMPVTIYGMGFKTVLEGDGEITVRQALLKAGETIKSLSVSGLWVSIDGNNIYVKTPYDTSAEDKAMGDAVTFSFGGVNFEVTAEEIDPDADGEEVTFGRAVAKFLAAYPQFEGAKFYFDSRAGVAIPYFDSKDGGALEENPSGQYEFYTDEGVKTLEGSPDDIRSAVLEGQTEAVEVQFYKSASGYYFYRLSSKKTSKANSGTSKNKGEAKKVKTSYALPFTIFIERYDEEIPVTAENFEGKTKVDADDLLKFLKKQTALLDKYPSLTKVLDKKADQQDLLYLPANEKRGSMLKVGLTTRSAG